MSAIDVRGLGFVYVHAARPAVRVVSFAVATGGDLAVSGGRGAGKSTTQNRYGEDVFVRSPAGR